MEGTEQTTGTRVLHGRREIVCAPRDVTPSDAWEVVQRALEAHAPNAADEDYLHRYFLGDQPVLRRVKDVRPDIRNVVVENRAYQICKDRADALAGEPIAYSAHANGRSHGDDVEAMADKVSHAVQRLNDACDAADKHACDIELVQWMCECGVGYRLVLPTPGMPADRPISVRCLDPRVTFVVRSNDVWREPVMGVTWVVDEVTLEPVYTCYTATRAMVMRGGRVVSDSPNPLGMVPIVEYRANSERMGVFEPVLTLLDAINEVESNRVDGIAQFVQSLMVLENVELESEDGQDDAATVRDMLRLGCIQIRSTDESHASVSMLTSELNQDQTQTLVDSMYKTVLSICGMPFNVGGSGSTSDTGAAVTMRDGWSNSESRCKETEAHFKRGERLFVEACCRILRASEGLELSPRDVEVKFTRRNYEAIQSKTQVLTTLLGSGRVHPRLAFEHCGMFADPEAAYDLSQQYVLGSGNQGNPGGDAASDGTDVGGDVNAAGKGTRPPSTKRSDRRDYQE